MTTGYIWNEDEGWYTETFTGGLLTYATSLDPDYNDNNGSTITLGGNGTDLVIGGTSGNDTITVGNGSDIIVGNNGNVTFTTLGVLTTIQSSDPEAWGSNTISAGYGNDFIVGGIGNNTITTTLAPPIPADPDSGPNTGGTNDAPDDDSTDDFPPVLGNNVIIGADGVISFSSSIWDWVNPTWYPEYGAPVLSVTSTDFGWSGNNVITASSGNTVVIGGEGSDQITVTNATDVVIGDSGQVTYSPSGGAFATITSLDPFNGGNDTITAGNGNDFIIGGSNFSEEEDFVVSHDLLSNDFFGDIINAGTGDNAIIGDNGSMTFTAWPPNRPTDDGWIGFQESILYYITSSDPNFGGPNMITAGGGNNVVIGGLGGNTITLGDGGEHGDRRQWQCQAFLSPGLDGTVETSDPVL